MFLSVAFVSIFLNLHFKKLRARVKMMLKITDILNKVDNETQYM